MHHTPEEEAAIAVSAAKAAAERLRAAPPIIRRTPRGYAVDVPLLYNGVAVDRMHLDPQSLEPLPKGMPEPPSPAPSPPEPLAAQSAAEKAARELRALDAAEYRGPEAAWAVPLAWRSLVVAHIRIRVAGGQGEVVPDEPLTLEVQRLLGRL